MPQDGAGKGESKPQAPSPDEYRRLEDEARALRGIKGVERRESSSPKAGMNAYLRYTGIGFQFLAMLGVPGALGYWLDTRLGTMPWLLLTGSLLGGAAAMIVVVREVLRAEEAEKRGKTEQGRKKEPGK